MSRNRTGWIGQDELGRWFYRFQYTDANGKRRNVRRIANSESNAKNLLRKSLNEHDRNGERALDGERLRFAKLADTYAEKKIFEAQYNGDRKIAGLRSHKSVERLLTTLRNYFANKLVKSITHSDVEEFKLSRLHHLKTNKTERSIASVNRELELLRAIMNFAKREGYIVFSPFERGASLISKADETRRERVISREEEKRLLNACYSERSYTYFRHGKQITQRDTGKRRRHLRTIIICALDTALRRGEIFKLKWSDVDLENRTIIIKAMNSKTARARIVGITPRLNDELTQLWRNSPQQKDLSVFGYDKPESTIKKAWLTACKIADIDDLHFHDLRHTSISRMVEAGLPTAQIMKVSGHTQMTTFQRYVNQMKTL